MKVLHDMRIQDKCQDCELRRAGFFCQLSTADLDEFASLKVTKAYPRGAMLFVEGQPSNGVFMLCQGKVKLSTCSAEGKIVIVGIAEPGEILGLSAAINGLEYETTAETLELCQVNCVPTSEFLHFLRTDPDACLSAARQLSRNYHSAFRQVCALGLSESVADKLAKLFLNWSRNSIGINGNSAVHLKNFFTHEEMAAMIGTSRETVTRVLRYFRENEILTLKGSDLVIHDRQRLKSVVGTRGFRAEM
jgi:CRP/FNR family transcriptional regulator